MKYFVSFLACALIPLGEPTTTCQPGALAGKARTASIRIDHDVNVRDQPLEYIFSDVLHGTGLYGGFVENGGCSDLLKGSLQIKQGVTLQQAMDALVAANPGYRWGLKDGAVNLIPQGGAPLLDARIADFQMDATDREVPAVLQDLLKLKEVKEREAALGLKQGIGHGRAEALNELSAQRKLPPVRISVQNVSLLEAFNKAVQASRDGIWVYHESDCNGDKTFVVEMRSGY